MSDLSKITVHFSELYRVREVLDGRGKARSRLGVVIGGLFRHALGGFAKGSGVTMTRLECELTRMAGAGANRTLGAHFFQGRATYNETIRAVVAVRKILEAYGASGASVRQGTCPLCGADKEKN